MSLTIREKKTAYKAKLPINEDTSSDTTHDIYDQDNKQYLYIKMDENIATAPFFYNRSFEFKELTEFPKFAKHCNKKCIYEMLIQ